MEVLGLAITAVTFVQKIPQIYYVYSAKSARGISRESIFLELWSYFVIIGYSISKSYTVLTYSEYICLVIQDIVLLYLSMYYDYNCTKIFLWFASAFIFLLVFINTAVAFNHFPEFLLYVLINTTTPINVGSKVTQMREIVDLGHSGQMSVTSPLIAALTSASRLLTYALQDFDLSLAAGVIVSTLLNLCLATVVLYFRKSAEKSK